MPHRFLNGFNLHTRSAGLLAVRRFWLVIIFSFNNPMFLFYLGNIQIRHMESVFLLYPVLNLLICSLSLSACQIQFVHIHFNFDMMLRLRMFGQKCYRFECCPPEQPNFILSSDATSAFLLFYTKVTDRYLDYLISRIILIWNLQLVAALCCPYSPMTKSPSV